MIPRNHIVTDPTGAPRRPRLPRVRQKLTRIEKVQFLAALARFEELVYTESTWKDHENGSAE